MSNRKGFTLIELLAVIVILGIVVAIAIPGINSVISNSRKNSLNVQNELIISATQKYIMENDIQVENDDTYTLTIQDLKNSGYFKKVINPVDNLEYDDDLTITINNNNHKLEYYINTPVNKKLLLHYDGINKTTNNSSPNKTTWIDLSDNKIDAELRNFTFNSTNGWTSNSLLFNGGSTQLHSEKVTSYNKGSFTVEIYLKHNSRTYAQLKVGPAVLKLRIEDKREYWNIYNSTDFLEKTGLVYNEQITLNEKTFFSLTYNVETKEIYYSKNNKFIDYPYFTFNPNDMFIQFHNEIFDGEIYSIKAYNIALSKEEIKQNYFYALNRFKN